MYTGASPHRFPWVSITAHPVAHVGVFHSSLIVSHGNFSMVCLGSNPFSSHCLRLGPFISYLDFGSNLTTLPSSYLLSVFPLYHCQLFTAQWVNSRPLSMAYKVSRILPFLSSTPPLLSPPPDWLLNLYSCCCLYPECFVFSH